MKTLIFDLDGTLLNTLEDLKNSTNYALKVLGFQEKSLTYVRNSVGNGLRNLMIRCLPEGSSEETVDLLLREMKRHYQVHCHDLTLPYEGILPMLERLKAEGYGLAIVSNKADPMVQELNRTFFDGLISVAVGEAPDCRRKPAPDMVNKALLRLGASAEDAIYIGDSEVDIQTAANSGLPCLSVGWGFRDPEVLFESGAKRVYASPADLYQAIKSL